MAKQLAIHIRPGAPPSSLIPLLDIVDKNRGSFESAKDLLEYANTQGLGSYAELNIFPSSMNLIQKTSEGVVLTETGKAFVSLREDAKADILHYLLYAGWSEKSPVEFLPSWTYRVCCNHYWTQGSVKLSLAYFDRQVEETINLARESFENLLSTGIYDEISFGRESLNGARKWLDALQPPVIEDNTFTRRAFCSPELMLLAIGYVLRDDPDATEIDILLSRDRREQICRVCLLSPESFDRTLDWAIPVFPKLIEPGTSAGTYGRFIRLHKMPSLQDVVR